MNRSRFGGILSVFVPRRRAGAATASARRKDLAALSDALLTGRGEASSIAQAREILTAYAVLGQSERLAYLQMLVDRFGPDPKRLARAISAYQAKSDHHTALELHNAAEARRQELIRQLNLAPEGIGSLVHMREDVLRCLKDQPGLAPLDADFHHLFSSWFNRGFLVLRPIDWDTPAVVLERIIRYEAVHQIKGWNDLRMRLEPGDRRCFGFFHPTWKDEPLIFVEVALTKSIPDAIGVLLTEERTPLAPQAATTAVFYSISNCHLGLRGVSFGNFLIKQVVEELKRELPNLNTFVTLSPAPGFTRWLRTEREVKGSSVLSPEDKRVLAHLDVPEWHNDDARCKALRRVVTHAFASYLLSVRDQAGKAVDAVARFHLGNGARLERINWLGDVSEKGLSQSAGLMVNYLYDLGQIERNHERFANAGEVVASNAVRRLLRRPRGIED